jgi:hypothetical protein
MQPEDRANAADLWAIYAQQARQLRQFSLGARPIALLDVLVVSGTSLLLMAEEREYWRDLDSSTTRRLAGEAIARILSIPPKTSWGSGNPPAHWIGAWTGAQAHLPRLDTPEFLATLSLDALRAAAHRAGQPSTGTAKALREQLAGQAADMTLPEAQFGAPGPKPTPKDDEETPA